MRISDWRSDVCSSDLCIQGRFRFDYVMSPERLTRPLVRRDDAPKSGDADMRGVDPLTVFREATWDEAMERAATGFEKILAVRGGQALAGFGSAKGSNEEAYLFQTLVRQGFGIDRAGAGWGKSGAGRVEHGGGQLI